MMFFSFFFCVMVRILLQECTVDQCEVKEPTWKFKSPYTVFHLYLFIFLFIIIIIFFFLHFTCTVELQWLEYLWEHG